MDLFAYAYYGLICGLLAIGSPLLETGFRRLLMGLTTGVIAGVALPFVRAMIEGGNTY